METKPYTISVVSSEPDVDCCVYDTRIAIAQDLDGICKFRADAKEMGWPLPPVWIPTGKVFMGIMERWLVVNS